MATYTPVAYTTAASNTQIDFDVTFTFLRSTDVVVSVIDPSGNVLVDGSDYDAELQALNNGTFDMRVVAAGTLNTTQTPLAANHVISLKRNTDISQLATVFQDGASFKAADINALITQLFNKIQEVEVSSGEGIGLTDDLLAFDAENKPLRNLGTPTANNDAMRKIDIDSGIGPDISAVAAIASDVSAVAADNTDIGTVAANLTGTDTIGTVSSNIANVNAVGGSIANVNAVAGNATNINAVAGNATNINTVAADAADINTIVANIADITAVAADATDIGTVAADIQVGGPDNIGTVATAIGDVGIVAGINGQVQTVATNIADVTAVAADATDIGTVSTNIANVNTVATNISDVNTLAPQATNISTLTQTANLTALQNAATNAAAAEAALNAFNRTYLGAYASDPTVDNNGDALTDGDLYFNSTSNNLKFYDASSSSWITLNNAVQVNAASTLQGVGDVDFAYSGGTTLAGNDFVVRDSTNSRWENQTPATARTTLGLGTAAVENVGAFATAAQGGLADAAVQPADLATVATSGQYSDLSGSPSLATVATSGQYSDLSGSPVLVTVATTGSYNDLTNLPTLGTAAAAATGDFATAAQGATADSALQPNAAADFGSNAITYSNVYSTTGDLPNASTYHGMFAHVHAEGKGYFAHAGSWQALQNEITTSTALAAASLTTYVTGDSGSVSVDVRKANPRTTTGTHTLLGGAALYYANANATYDVSALNPGDIVTIYCESGTVTVGQGSGSVVLFKDGEATGVASNQTVQIGADTIATVTCVTTNKAIIAGSDLT